MHRSRQADVLTGRSLCGLLYEKGIGTIQNLPEAVKWFDKAAQLGNAQAMLIMGEKYWDGVDLKQDKVKAYTYILLASTADLPTALQDKDRYERELSKRDIDKGRKQAGDWSRTHRTLHLRACPLIRGFRIRTPRRKSLSSVQ